MDAYNPLKGLISFAAGIAFYAGWYFYEFGQWCPAMWYGSAPPVFIGVTTLLFYRILDRVE